MLTRCSRSCARIRRQPPMWTPGPCCLSILIYLLLDSPVRCLTCALRLVVCVASMLLSGCCLFVHNFCTHCPAKCKRRMLLVPMYICSSTYICRLKPFPFRILCIHKPSFDTEISARNLSVLWLYVFPHFILLCQCSSCRRRPRRLVQQFSVCFGCSMRF